MSLIANILYNYQALFLVLSLLAGSNVLAQVTFTTTGNWRSTANWSGANIGDLITENVTINANRNPTLISGDNYTVGDVTADNGVALNVNSGARLNVGASGTPKRLTFANNGTLYCCRYS